jgi:hypothetical protein
MKFEFLAIRKQSQQLVEKALSDFENEAKKRGMNTENLEHQLSMTRWVIRTNNKEQLGDLVNILSVLSEERKLTVYTVIYPIRIDKSQETKYIIDSNQIPFLD